MLLPEHGFLALADTEGAAGAGMGFKPLPDFKAFGRLLAPGQRGRISGLTSEY
jgi:hypothetical protein